MEYVTRALTNLNQFYREINPSTLTGAIDIIVVQHEDGTLHSSPFHVRFGKLRLLRPHEKLVDVYINGAKIPFQMKLGEAGEAFFVSESEISVPQEYATSPIITGLEVTNSGIEPLDLLSNSPTEVNDPSDPFEPNEKLDGYVSAHESDFEVEISVPPSANDSMALESQKAEHLFDPPYRTLSECNSPPNEIFLDKNYQDYGPSSDIEEAYDRDYTLNGPLSDTELEMGDNLAAKRTRPEWSWGWGTLPKKRINAIIDDVEEWIDPDMDIPIETKITIDDTSYDIAASLCGIDNLTEDERENRRIFQKYMIAFDQFDENTEILNDNKLVIRYEKQYYSWLVAAPMLASLILFKRPLSMDVIDKLDERDKAARKSTWRSWWSLSSKSSKTATSGKEDVPKKYYAKSLRLTSEQLAALNLNKGANVITFKVSSSSARAQCSAKIFLWEHDCKVIISDIDGTITKSDALGHILTIMGRDWTHHGVAKLYTDICSNNYKIMYLTSRAIGQADATRGYLKGVQQGLYQLPDGPVVMSPDRLFTSFHREVIIRKPQLFKMACLKDIERLFGDRQPFYAGFGNRITDAVSYRHVHVPASRIFTIDHYGELRRELLHGFKSSYVSLNDLVDQIFPSLDATTGVECEYNDWNYWKAPLPPVEMPSRPRSQSVGALGMFASLTLRTTE